MKKFYRDYLVGNLPFWVCLGISIALIVASWFVPPMGVIDGSILAGVGELFGFASLWAVYKAIDKGTPATISHGDTTVTINKEGDDNAGSEGID